MSSLGGDACVETLVLISSPGGEIGLSLSAEAVLFLGRAPSFDGMARDASTLLQLGLPDPKFLYSTFELLNVMG